MRDRKDHVKVASIPAPADWPVRKADSGGAWTSKIEVFVNHDKDRKRYYLSVYVVDVQPTAHGTLQCYSLGDSRGGNLTIESTPRFNAKRFQQVVDAVTSRLDAATPLMLAGQWQTARYTLAGRAAELAPVNPATVLIQQAREAATGTE